MRILHVIPGEENGPSMIFAKRQVEALKNKRVVVDVFYLHVWESFRTLIKEYRRLESFIERTKPDIVHAHFGSMTGVLCAVLVKSKLVITYRGSDLQPTPYESKRRSILSHMMSHAAAMRADGIICVSRRLTEYLWIKTCPVEVIPSPVDTELFFPMNFEAARAELGWSEKERIVLSIICHHPLDKGLAYIVEAVEMARRSIENIKLVVLNGGVEPNRMPLYYSAADCLIVASNYEGSPNMVKEAMACNLPVVTTPVGDVEERLANVKPSRVVPRETVRMANALTNILETRKRSNGREHVTEITINVLTKKLIRFYQHVMEKK